MRRLICLVIGHGAGELRQDGKGAAWYVCRRCRKVTNAVTFHGGRPWSGA